VSISLKCAFTDSAYDNYTNWLNFIIGEQAVCIFCYALMQILAKFEHNGAANFFWNIANFGY
jgi:hypothetical protein